jgi:hypothetical protein
MHKEDVVSGLLVYIKFKISFDTKVSKLKCIGYVNYSSNVYPIFMKLISNFFGFLMNRSSHRTLADNIYLKYLFYI